MTLTELTQCIFQRKKRFLITLFALWVILFFAITPRFPLANYQLMFRLTTDYNLHSPSGLSPVEDELDQVRLKVARANLVAKYNSQSQFALAKLAASVSWVYVAWSHIYMLLHVQAHANQLVQVETVFQQIMDRYLILQSQSKAIYKRELLGHIKGDLLAHHERYTVTKLKRLLAKDHILPPKAEGVIFKTMEQPTYKWEWLLLTLLLSFVMAIMITAIDYWIKAVLRSFLGE